ncbi:MAG: alkaline phosphatase D family protein [Planctomycetes bacterium]|nr:alkaline phosphatase D family protein [Planctomycetota bacterium]
MLRQRSIYLILGVVFWMGPNTGGSAAEMAMGFRVGEVTHDSAIVWTRVTRESERKWDGYREPSKRQPKQSTYAPSEIKVEDRDGATPGAKGEVRVVVSSDDRFNDARRTDWVAVAAEHDFVHQFRLKDLKSATRYHLKVEARDSKGSEVSATVKGSFGTPAAATAWQDVDFGVVTGQSYWDLDHREGYHIYPAMQKLNLDFLVPTGDTVYLDSEAPRARTVELARLHWQRMYSLPRHVEFHRNVPGYWEVDDHDAWANDCWPTMKAAWMNPLTFVEGFGIYREQVPMGDMTYRTVRWGKGLQIWMVEGRLYRSPNTMNDSPGKTIWGDEQLAWLQRTIEQSDADFRVLVSPTPIVGPDRDKGKNDNHANDSFSYEGHKFRSWTKSSKLKNFYTCCGDRHWQYMSIDPSSGLREFSCGPASDSHAGGNPRQPEWQPFLRVKGGFLTVSVTKPDGTPTIAFRHRDVRGKVVHEFTASSANESE